jgi:hypothetical protein
MQIGWDANTSARWSAFMPFLEMKRSSTCRPFGVSMYVPRSLKRFDWGSDAFSIRRASMKCWHMALAMSRVIENVVVVVVVTIRDGSLGSGPRLDWANLSEARLAAASSLRKAREA